LVLPKRRRWCAVTAEEKTITRKVLIFDAISIFSVEAAAAAIGKRINKRSYHSLMNKTEPSYFIAARESRLLES
jgi:hypothetical protein